jgi:hypothetical protein
MAPRTCRVAGRLSPASITLALSPLVFPPLCMTLGLSVSLFFLLLSTLCLFLVLSLSSPSPLSIPSFSTPNPSPSPSPSPVAIPALSPLHRLALQSLPLQSLSPPPISSSFGSPCI